MSTILVTVADDRSGRKGGAYGKTQDFILDLFSKNPDFGIDKFLMWKWEDIKNSRFYEQYKHRLDITEPQINGRLYKPLAIKEGLSLINDDEFLIYNDTSPELWNDVDKINWSKYDIGVVQKLCVQNGGILTAHAGFDHDGFNHVHVAWPHPGFHTHEIFTKQKCLDVMDPDGKFKFCLQHASGFIVLQKNEKSIKFVDDWIHYNSDPDCVDAIGTDAQHRTDQSISGILINRLGNRLVRCLPGQLQHTVINPYNLLSFCQINTVYNFTDSIQPKREKRIYLDDNKINNPAYVGKSFIDNWCVEYRK